MKIHISDTTNDLLISCSSSDCRYITEEREPTVIHTDLLQVYATCVVPSDSHSL